ncbi:MAG: T9SS type A sorting domain-containing protein [Bacteroidota bacterium]
MKRSFFLMIICLLRIVYVEAQNDGSLCLFATNTSFFQTYKAGELGIYTFQTQQYQTIDSLTVADLQRVGSHLIVGGIDLRVYEGSTGSLLQNKDSLFIRRLDDWGDKFVAISDSAPYLRVFDLNLTQTASLDTLLLPTVPHDISVLGDSAFINFPQSVWVIDLLSMAIVDQDSATAQYGWLDQSVVVNGRVYFDDPLPTAVPRFELLRYQPDADTLERIGKIEINFTEHEALAGKDKAYFGMGFSHVSALTDSFFSDTLFAPKVLAHDAISDRVFFSQYNDSLMQFDLAIRSHTGVLSPPFLQWSTNFAQAVYFENSLNSIISDTPPDIRVYPNPASESFSVDITGGGSYPVRIELLDLRGKTVYQSTATLPFKFSTAGIPAGIYVVQVRMQNRVFLQKLFIQS